MPRFRYDTTGRWFKGNTHIHSQASDGGETFAEIATRYARVGYDFLFRTNHWVAADVAADPATYPLLWLDGVELDGADTTGAYYHVVALGTFTGLTRELGFVPPSTPPAPRAACSSSPTRSGPATPSTTPCAGASPASRSTTTSAAGSTARATATRTGTPCSSGTRRRWPLPPTMRT